jgi:hypothetical protein
MQIEIPDDLINKFTDREWWDTLMSVRNLILLQGMTDERMAKQQVAKKMLLNLVHEIDPQVEQPW